MSGAAPDPLDQALHQERAELVLAVSGNPVNSAMAWQIIHRWDALLEVARAARDVVQGAVPVGGDDPYDRLVAALARLDGNEPA